MAAMRNALQNPPLPLNVARAVPPASLPAANAIPAVLANPLHPLIPMLERLLVGESAPAQGFNGNIRAPIALPEHKLVAVLLARCSIDPNPVLSNQLRKLPLYKLQLTASAWQRVLDELILSGLLGNGLNGFTCTLSQLDARLRQLQILNPEKLVIADTVSRYVATFGRFFTTQNSRCQSPMPVFGAHAELGMRCPTAR